MPPGRIGWWCRYAANPTYHPRATLITAEPHLTWQDHLAIWSFIVTVIGTVGTIIGFVVAFFQLRKTRTAAQAATEAVTRAMKESQRYVVEYSLGNVAGFLTEAARCVQHDRWGEAAMRLSDVSETMSQLARTLSNHGPEAATWLEMQKQVQEWAAKFQTKAKIASTRYSHEKWVIFIGTCKSEISKHHGVLIQLTESCPNDSTR